MMDFDSARRTMVDTQLRPSGVTDDRLLASMGRLPRENFVPVEMQPVAYSDTDVQLIPHGRSMAAPTVLAKLVQLANVASTDVVLDVGCGTGYSAAVLAELASAVVGIENDAALVEKANQVLTDLDVGNAAVLEAELSSGVPSEAPFDVIVLEGAVDEVPAALLKQLKDGGKLVAMVHNNGVPTAEIHLRTGKDISVRRDFNMALPPLESLVAKAEFSF